MTKFAVSIVAWTLSMTLGFFTTASAHAGPANASLDATLASLQARSPLPGFCVAIVDASGVRYAEGFGYADVAAKRPYSANTIQPVASVSKTLIGVALMQAIEDDLVGLDNDVRDVLPFRVANPGFPNSPITLRQLATHTSSIIDREPFYDHTYFPGTQTAFDLKDFLLAYIEPDGEFYNLKNFSAYPPGARFEYSNVGADLAAFVVEAVRGVSYASYTRQRILKPLHMDASGWSPEETKGPLATLYDQHRKVIAPYSFPSYADGGLFSSCNDLGRFLSAMIRGYKGKSGLLRPELFRAMLTPQFSRNHPPRNIGPDDEPNEGIFWEFSRRGEIGHSGGDPGIDTHMFFNPESGIGRILITNMSGDGGRRDVDEELETIWKTLGTSEGKFVTGPGS